MCIDQWIPYTTLSEVVCGKKELGKCFEEIVCFDVPRCVALMRQDSMYQYVMTDDFESKTELWETAQEIKSE